MEKSMYFDCQNENVKPCGSCGKVPKFRIEPIVPRMYALECSCGKYTGLFYDMEEAIKEWNAKESEGSNMIMTEKEMDEQIALYMKQELKPCRCGVVPHLEGTEINKLPTKYSYTCPNCGLSSVNCDTEAEARKDWNALVERPLPNCAIKDSGERREFETGAVRDMSEGKGLMVVMPAAALLRLSRHYEHGAKKYGKFNWQKGIPISSFMDSALRHIMKYLDGWDDEDHLAAAAFNILGAMEMEANKPAMQDIPAREGAASFNYKQEA